MRNCLVVFLFVLQTMLFSQTVVTRYSVDLKKASVDTQVLSALDEHTQEVFVCMATDKKIKILNYNRAFFLKDEFEFPRRNTVNRSLVGYSFNTDGSPTLYWFSEKTRDFIVVNYSLKTKTFKELKFRFPFNNFRILVQYQNENTFNLVVQQNYESTLFHYTFTNGEAQEKIINFNQSVFKDSNSKTIDFSQILIEHPIELIEKDTFTPLYQALSKTKMYIEKDHLILTLDHNLRSTQLLDVNLTTLEIIEKSFPYKVIDKVYKSTNSFYENKKLYQIVADKDNFCFQVKSTDSNASLKDVIVSKNDTIPFKNSALILQRDNGKPRELKNTSKFLQHLATSNVGLSVFNIENSRFITIGGMSYYETDEGYLHSKSVYFESLWNEDLEYSADLVAPFAIDKINSFLYNQKELRFENTINLGEFQILGYYDSAKKEYVMRKFTNDFWWKENENPLLEKPLFQAVRKPRTTN